MNVLLLCDPRTGSKFFLKNINALLKEEYGQTAHIDWASVHGLSKPINTDFMGLAEIFSNNYGLDRTQYVLYEKHKNCYDFKLKDVQEPFNKMLDIEHRLNLLSNASVPFVAKLFYEYCKDFVYNENFLKFLETKIDVIVLLTRSNLEEWTISRAILKNFIKAQKLQSGICETFKNTSPVTIESINTLKQINEERETYFNFLVSQFSSKVYHKYDISVLPKIIKINGLQFENNNLLEFRQNNNYKDIYLSNNSETGNC